MKYRAAERKDLLQLLELEQSVIEAERPFNEDIKPKNVTYYDMEHLIADPDTLLLVAEDSGQIIGTGYAQLRASKSSLSHKEHAYLGFMYVAPDYRRQGINQSILDQLVSWSRDRGINSLYLEVYARNEPAVTAYRKAGFAPCTLEMKLTIEDAP